MDKLALAHSLTTLADLAPTAPQLQQQSGSCGGSKKAPWSAPIPHSATVPGNPPTNQSEKIPRASIRLDRKTTKGTRRGVFFCAVVGRESDVERTYLRFIGADDDWQPRLDDEAVESELGTCLRLIECSSDTPVWFPDTLRDRVYEFWEVAQDDILRDWMRETDPANLQPAIRPLNHRVAAFIREHPPFDVPEDRMTRALDILESPWPRREEIMLRGWYEASEQEGAARAQLLIERIVETGLEPVSPPPPLPPISRVDIELLCWIGIEPQDVGLRQSS